MTSPLTEKMPYYNSGRSCYRVAPAVGHAHLCHESAEKDHVCECWCGEVLWTPGTEESSGSRDG